jgi:hypothetical protein
MILERDNSSAADNQQGIPRQKEPELVPYAALMDVIHNEVDLSRRELARRAAFLVQFYVLHWFGLQQMPHRDHPQYLRVRQMLEHELEKIAFVLSPSETTRDGPNDGNDEKGEKDESDSL